MAFTSNPNNFVLIVLSLLCSQYDQTKFMTTAIPLIDDDLEITRYLAHELPYQLDKGELIDDPFVRIEKAPEPVIRVQEGESVTLQCGAIGIPPPVIYWRKDGKRVKQAYRDDETNAFEKLTNIGSMTVESSTTTGRLRLDCIVPSMAGVYDCVAENGYGRVSNRTRLVVVPREAVSPLMSDSCARAVENAAASGTVAPSIVMYTEFRFENQGNNVQLFCRATGYPTPKISWLDDDEQPLLMNENQFVLPNGDLFVRNVQGYAQYFCVATNEAGEDRADSFVYATA